MKSDGHISAMKERLRELRAEERAERLSHSVLRWIEDPLKPKTVAGRLRVNRILLVLASLVVMTTATFLFFNLVQP